MPLPQLLQPRAWAVRILATLVLLGVFGACAGPADKDLAAPLPRPEPTATPVPTPTPTPTVTPTPTAVPTPDPGVASAQRIRYGDDPAQIGWLSLPERDRADAGPTPVVVLVHGGFWAEPWDYTLMSDLAAGLTDRGIAAWNIEFRRLRGRGGWPATFDDVRNAINHLSAIADEHPIDLDRVVVMGHSSGGHLALWAARDDVATTPPIQRSIGLAAITDLRLTTASIGLLGGTPSEVPDRWDAAAPSFDPDRVLLVHGTADTTVPLFAVDNAVDAGVGLTVVPDADHLDLITAGTPAFDQVLEVVEGALSSL